MLQRRRLAVVAGVLALAVAVAAWGWRTWLPRYRPSLDAGEAYGIDVSEHQGWVDWDAVAEDGISFAYIKATEGGDYIDRWFTRNWSTAAGAGLTRGAYHLFTLCTAGERQAQNFVQALPRDPAALPPAVDLELAGNCRARPARAVVDRELRAFLSVGESTTGRRVVLYVADDFEERYGVRASLDRPAWDRRFLRRPESDDWVVWQVGGFAHVDGIRGRVDLDVFRRTVQETP